MADKKLYEERGQIQKSLDDIISTVKKEKREFSAEEDAKWDELNARDAQLRKLIERENAVAAARRELESVQDDGVDRRNFPASAAGKLKGDDDTSPMSEEDYQLAFQSWLQRGRTMRVPLTAAQKRACRKYRRLVDRRFDPNSPEIACPFAGQTRMIKGLQRDIRNSNVCLRDGDWRDIERRDMSTSTNDTLIAQSYVRQLELAQLYYGPMLQTSQIIVTTQGGAFNWPTADDTGNTGELLGEAGSIGSSVDPTTSGLTLNDFTFSSKPVKVSHEQLEDSMFDLDSIIFDMLGERLGRVQNTYYTTGNGTGQPRGIVNAATLGVTAALGSGFSDEEMISLEHSVDRPYRKGAGWMMHDLTLAAVRKIKDEQGRMIYVAGLQDGVADRLLGYSMAINNDMAAIDNEGDGTDAGEKVLLFGKLSDYKVRRIGAPRLVRLDELYMGNNQVGFISFVRADGDLLETGIPSVKYLQLHS